MEECTDQSPQCDRLDSDLLAVEIATAQQQVGDLEDWVNCSAVLG